MTQIETLCFINSPPDYISIPKKKNTNISKSKDSIIVQSWEWNTVKLDHFITFHVLYKVLKVKKGKKKKKEKKNKSNTTSSRLHIEHGRLLINTQFPDKSPWLRSLPSKWNL